MILLKLTWYLLDSMTHKCTIPIPIKNTHTHLHINTNTHQHVKTFANTHTEMEPQVYEHTSSKLSSTFVHIIFIRSFRFIHHFIVLFPCDILWCFFLFYSLSLALFFCYLQCVNSLHCLANRSNNEKYSSEDILFHSFIK